MRRFRAFADTFGVFTFLWDGTTRVKIEKMTPVSSQDISPATYNDLIKLPPGRITFERDHNRLLISCRDGLVAVGRLKVEGKNSTDAIGFANGYLKPRGTLFSFRVVVT